MAESIKEIPLTQGKVAIVDVADYAHLNQWKWQAHFNKRAGRWYASRSIRIGKGQNAPKKTILMHRFVLDAPHGMEVDHRDGDGLNNCRSTNLRLATHHENQRNRGPKSK